METENTKQGKKPTKANAHNRKQEKKSGQKQPDQKVWICSKGGTENGAGELRILTGIKETNAVAEAQNCGKNHRKGIVQRSYKRFYGMSQLKHPPPFDKTFPV